MVGSLLTYIATQLKERQDARYRVGRLVTKLLIFNNQIITIMDTDEWRKDLATDKEGKTATQEYERLRQNALSKHFMIPPVDFESLVAATNEIAGVLPLEAVRLQSNIESLDKIKKSSLQATSSNIDLYIRGLSAYEAAMEIGHKDIHRLILVLSKKLGLVTYARIYFHIRALEKKRKVADPLSDRIFGGVSDRLREIKQSSHDKTEPEEPSG